MKMKITTLSRVFFSSIIFFILIISCLPVFAKKNMLLLYTGQSYILDFSSKVTRVVGGDPSLIELNLFEKEKIDNKFIGYQLLISPVGEGKTNIIVWTEKGLYVFDVEIDNTLDQTTETIVQVPFDTIQFDVPVKDTTVHSGQSQEKVIFPTIPQKPEEQDPVSEQADDLESPSGDQEVSKNQVPQEKVETTKKKNKKESPVGKKIKKGFKEFAQKVSPKEVQDKELQPVQKKEIESINIDNKLPEPPDEPMIMPLNGIKKRNLPVQKLEKLDIKTIDIPPEVHGQELPSLDMIKEYTAKPAKKPLKSRNSIGDLELQITKHLNYGNNIVITLMIKNQSQDYIYLGVEKMEAYDDQEVLYKIINAHTEESILEPGGVINMELTLVPATSDVTSSQTLTLVINDMNSVKRGELTFNKLEGL